MTGRDRLNAVLKKKPTDRLPWTTLVDNASLDRFPEELRGNGGIDFYRHLGCDIFLLNGWNTPHSFRCPELKWPEDVEFCIREENGKTIKEWKSSQGTLTGISDRGHPVKYPVDCIRAVSIYRQMWEGVTFVSGNDTAALLALDALIGNDGVVTRFWGPSTIPQLLEQDMGTENFYLMVKCIPETGEGLALITDKSQPATLASALLLRSSNRYALMMSGITV